MEQLEFVKMEWLITSICKQGIAVVSNGRRAWLKRRVGGSSFLEFKYMATVSEAWMCNMKKKKKRKKKRGGISNLYRILPCHELCL